KDTMVSIGEPVIPSKVVTTVSGALDFAMEIGYPAIVRPAFTLGGTGGGIAETPEELKEIATNGIRLSPIGQILIEKCVSGWKEIEFEVIRDKAGNKITVCSMENVDPVGVHTGDSIVVAPAVTLSKQEYEKLRTAALNIVEALGVFGGCNCQFALHPTSGEYAVIEVNPRVSRSSALASKATGYPIAKVAAKIAVGYQLDEIINVVPGKKSAFFEPELDYIVVKVPKFPFDKFIYAKRTLGTQMKATGEVMAIGSSFEHALMKAIRGAEIGVDSLNLPQLAFKSDAEIKQMLSICDDRRIFVVFEALKRGISTDVIYEATKIDYWFLEKLRKMAEFELSLPSNLTEEAYLKGKKLGFPDSVLERLSGQKVTNPMAYSYRMVHDCSAESATESPYFYSVCGGENEAKTFIEQKKSNKKRVIVFGSGPIRIGQGIEFDYASVHCVWALKKAGFEVIIVNNNPETVSTDFDTGDRLYFEPLTPEDVMHIIRTEQPYGVVVAFGGQTAIKLTKFLDRQGVKILGTSPDSIDEAEDRNRFDALLERLSIKRPAGAAVNTEEEALATAARLGFPVLIRPSYVLGGQNMTIAFCEDDVKEYMRRILETHPDAPVLIDQYLMGVEIEVDAICDGKDILIPGIMEHVERAGVHSGDSIAVYPAWNLTGALADELVEYTKKLALALETKGLINIQYVIRDHEIYVIEVNPRSSRTVPYISKVTGVPMVELATRAMLGEPLADMGFGTGLYQTAPYVAVKVPVFSFEKLADVDTLLGPEMKSTGEVLGLGKTLDEALYKGMVAAGYTMKKTGGVLMSVQDIDKAEVVDTAKSFAALGFQLYATKGTAALLTRAGLSVETVSKLHEEGENVIDYLESGKVDYVVSTSSKGRIPSRDSVKIRRKAVERAIPCLTSLDTANALVLSLKSRYSQNSTELVDINRMRKERQTLKFVKLHGTGNDYIYFDCLQTPIQSPESLSVHLSERNLGIGGCGIILIEPSLVADAKMRIFNRDGSEASMCGNGIRCVGKYLFDNGLVSRHQIAIETLSGVKSLTLYERGGKVHSVRVNMGKAELAPEKVPVLLPGPSVLGRKVAIDGKDLEISCVSMGNPQCVVFCDEVDLLAVETLGPAIENASIFPERTNVAFVQVVSKNTLKVRIWERGSGESMASGTGACAAAVAAAELGYCEKGGNINVRLKGGTMLVQYTDEAVYMTGDAVKAFEGTVEV
ncbi:MAG TPA: carbamoyl-phosphate synthase large subunit, partial [Clostridiales bacterium]|nr:carbamoyl-phosphate synthase large subunit [Clostridiales bacterium]